MSRQLLKAYVEAWNKKDLNVVTSFYADDVIYSDLGVKKTMTKAAVIEFITGFFNNNADIHFDIISDMISERAIAWEWRMVVTRKNGDVLDRFGMSMMEIRDGKISQNRDYWSVLKAPS